MSDLSSLRNIGTEIEKKLITAGITTAKELKEIGSIEAYIRVKAYYPNICLVHLYVLEGAIIDEDYNRLPEDVKRNLKDFHDTFR